METVAEQITRILEQDHSVRCSNALHKWVEVMMMKENRFLRKCVKCENSQEYKEGKWGWIKND